MSEVERKKCTACKMDFPINTFKQKRNGDYYKQCYKCCRYKNNRIPQINYNIEALYKDYCEAYDIAKEWLDSINKDELKGYLTATKEHYENVLYNPNASLITNYKGLKDDIGLELIKHDNKYAIENLKEMTEHLYKQLDKWKKKYAEKGYI